MLEIEVKYRCPDPAAVAAKLAAWGATRAEPRTDADHYFNAPDRDFAKTDEAFRLRRIGPRNLLTYKGPKLDAATKTRTEVEIPLGDGDEVAADAAKMLTHLGYRPVAVVRKHRQVYQFARDGFDLEACLDDVAGVGSFAELEIIADESHAEAAKAVVLAAAADLGLTDLERRSYLEMYLSSQGR